MLAADCCYIDQDGVSPSTPAFVETCAGLCRPDTIVLVSFERRSPEVGGVLGGGMVWGEGDGTITTPLAAGRLQGECHSIPGTTPHIPPPSASRSGAVSWRRAVVGSGTWSSFHRAPSPSRCAWSMWTSGSCSCESSRTSGSCETGGAWLPRPAPLVRRQWGPGHGAEGARGLTGKSLPTQTPAGPGIARPHSFRFSCQHRADRREAGRQACAAALTLGVTSAGSMLRT